MWAGRGASFNGSFQIWRCALGACTWMGAAHLTIQETAQLVRVRVGVNVHVQLAALVQMRQHRENRVRARLLGVGGRAVGPVEVKPARIAAKAAQEAAVRVKHRDQLEDVAGAQLGGARVIVAQQEGQEAIERVRGRCLACRHVAGGCRGYAAGVLVGTWRAAWVRGWRRGYVVGGVGTWQAAWIRGGRRGYVAGGVGMWLAWVRGWRLSPG